MQEEGRELMRQTGEHNNVGSSSDWPSSSSPENLREVRESVSYRNIQVLYAQTPSIGDKRLHEYHQKSDISDPPPTYVEAIYDYKNPPHQVYELHNISNTRTREAREEEAIASDNMKKYKQRVKGCKRFIIVAGVLYAFAAAYLIHWYKQIDLRFSRNQEEALRNVIFVSNINISKPYEGRLVHVVGPLSISEPLMDPECGFTISSVKLKRFVHNSEIYMMVKGKQGSNDSSETEPRYYYTRKGGDTLLNSNQMCVNPKIMNLQRWDIKDQVQTAKEVKIGSLTLGTELKEKFNEYVYVTDKMMELKNDNAVRLMFWYAGKDGNIFTVIGKLDNGVILPYRTLQGDEILLKRMDAITAEEMIRSRQFDSDFEFFRRSYVISIFIIILGIALIYYCKVHPLRPRENN